MSEPIDITNKLTDAVEALLQTGSTATKEAETKNLIIDSL